MLLRVQSSTFKVQSCAFGAVQGWAVGTLNLEL